MSSHFATPPIPFGLSLPFDRLRMIGNTNRQNTKPTPFGLSPSFDRLRMIGNSNKPKTKPNPFGLSLPFDRLRTIGNTNRQNTKPKTHPVRAEPVEALVRPHEHFEQLSSFDRLRMHGHFDKLSVNGCCVFFQF
jgi:hypothetical protein